jgi:hypothetical protein
MVWRSLVKTNFLFVITEMSALEDRLKLTVHFLANLWHVLLGLMDKIDLRQRLCRVLDLRQRIRQHLERVTILPVVGDQPFAVVRLLGLFPLMSPHEAL